MNDIFRRVLLFPILSLMFVACEEKQLCYDHSHLSPVEVVFDWKECPDADPRTMVVHFFTPDGKEYRRVEFDDRSGGNVRLEAGDYTVFFHNGEMATVVESGSTYDDYALTCQLASVLEPMGRTDDPPRPEHAADQRIAGAPEQVWSGVGEPFTVKRRNYGQKVVFTPAETTCEYIIEFVNVENLSENNISISAALTGMSDCYNLSRQSHTGQPATIPLSLSRVDDSTLRAEFRVFGHCPAENLPHTITVYTSDQRYYNFNITDQIHYAPDPRHVYIRIEGLSLPVPGGGMSTTVSDWEEVVYVDVPMR